MADLEVKALSHFFGDHLVLGQVQCSFQNGTVTALLGANGAGKTTLLRILARRLPPSRGAVFLNQRDIYASRAMRGLFCEITHQPQAYPDLSAYENLFLMSKLQGARDPQEKCKAIIERVGATEFSERTQVRNLSKGQQLRVSLALAILQQPQVLLLDEPTSSLDAAGTALVTQFIQSERARGVVVVVATHDRPWISTLADQSLQLADGKLASA